MAAAALSTATNAVQKKFAKFSGIGKKKAKILLIDDEIKMSELLRSSLEKKYNCKIVIAADPFEAMNILTENYFDLVILDWGLPSLTGGQTLNVLEKGFVYEPNLPRQWDMKKVPVVVFSGSDDNTFFQRTSHFSCVGFISKNQSFKKMVESFGQFLKPKPEATMKPVQMAAQAAPAL